MKVIEQIVRITTDGDETKAEVIGEIVRCKDCKHRDGIDGQCPVQSTGDPFYDYKPDDNWFCAEANERRQRMKRYITVEDALNAMCDNCDSVQAVCPHYPCKQYKSIEQLPSAQPDYDLSGYSDRLWKSAYERGKAEAESRWILVTERLPENIKPVIVTWENTDPKSYYQYIVGEHFIGTAHYKSGKWYWYSSVTEDLLAEYGRCDSEELDEAIEVIAWMPLPEPYREEKEDE